MGDFDRIATTGFSKMSERQVGIWETGGLTNVTTFGLDQSAGVMMPFWSDNNLLFLGTPIAFHGPISFNVTHYLFQLEKGQCILNP